MSNFIHALAIQPIVAALPKETSLQTIPFTGEVLARRQRAKHATCPNNAAFLLGRGHRAMGRLDRRMLKLVNEFRRVEPHQLMFMNVTAGTLAESGVSTQWFKTLRQINTSNLVIELGEDSVATNKLSLFKSNVEKIYHMGIPIALDDFGSEDIRHLCAVADFASYVKVRFRDLQNLEIANYIRQYRASGKAIIVEEVSGPKEVICAFDIIHQGQLTKLEGIYFQSYEVSGRPQISKIRFSTGQKSPPVAHVPQ